MPERKSVGRDGDSTANLHHGRGASKGNAVIRNRRPIVVWMGEFGRTPRINGSISRDHWPGCYTVLLAGGGVKRGYIHGASDKHGAMPDREPATPDDVAATMFHLLGIPYDTEVHDAANRPLPIAAGRPIYGAIA